MVTSTSTPGSMLRGKRARAQARQAPAAGCIVSKQRAHGWATYACHLHCRVHARVARAAAALSMHMWAAQRHRHQGRGQVCREVGCFSCCAYMRPVVQRVAQHHGALSVHCTLVAGRTYGRQAGRQPVARSARASPDRGDLLHHIRRGVQVDEALVDPAQQQQIGKLSPIQYSSMRVAANTPMQSMPHTTTVHASSSERATLAMPSIACFASCETSAR